MIKNKTGLSIFLFLLVSTVYCQQLITIAEFKEALVNLGDCVKNNMVNLETPSNDFRIYESSQKASLTNFKFLKDKRVFHKYYNHGFNEKEYLNRYTILLGALKALKDNEEVLSKLKINFSEYKAIIDGCGCVSENEESIVVKADPLNNFAAFWNCNELGKLQLRYSYNEVFGIYFSEIIIEYPKIGPR